MKGLMKGYYRIDSLQNGFWCKAGYFATRLCGWIMAVKQEF